MNLETEHILLIFNKLEAHLEQDLIHVEHEHLGYGDIETTATCPAFPDCRGVSFGAGGDTGAELARDHLIEEIMRDVLAEVDFTENL